jgi:transposase-like protein
MALIIPAILSLVEHLKTLQTNPEVYRPEQCPHCGKAGPWCHGCYFRQSDRESPGRESLNPVPIPRFRCPHCNRTCSVLPECIPPRRWYLWAIQQIVLTLRLAGCSIRHISERVLPCRRTIQRWQARWKERFALHSFHLRNRIPDLGRYPELQTFWQACLLHVPLSSAMLLLNEREVVVP